MAHLLLSAFSSLALILGVLFGVLWLVRRQGAIGRRAPAALRVDARLALGRNQGVAVVHWEGRAFLVAYGEGGVRPIDHAQAPAFGETLAAVRTQDAEAPASSGATDAGEAATRRPSAARVVPLPLVQQARRFLGGLLVAAAVGAGSGGALAAQSPSSLPQPLRSDGEPMVTSGFTPALAQLPPLSVQMGEEGEGFRLDGTVGTVVLFGLLAVAPTLLLLTTSFTRILVVLHFLRQALGTQNTPPGHLLAALALLLTGVVMAPTAAEIHRTAIQPWSEGVIDEGAMLERAVVPLREFMLDHTRTEDLRTFLDLDVSGEPVATEADVPSVTLMSAFALSELRAAFEIGFALFLPFVVIDLVVAAVLTSMGMFMLPPTMIALPCKLMLFVLMDGWSLVVTSVVQSFV